MINLITAVSKHPITLNMWGLGINDNMAWHCKDELRLFNQKTVNHILIMGRKTVQNLPKLTDRTIYCISRKGVDDIDTSSWKNTCIFFDNIDNAISDAKINFPEKKIFIAGGGEIYKYVLNNYSDQLIIHISYMKNIYTCDTFLSLSISKSNYILHEHIENPLFTHIVVSKHKNIFNEVQYLNLVQEVLYTGESRNGRNGSTLSLFSRHVKFDLLNGFPLLTTKKMFTRGIIEELLFFIRGETNSKLLEEKKVNIWKGNTSRQFLNSVGLTAYDEGMMGPMYGYQWRRFNSPYNSSDEGIDQLQNVIDLIKNDPHSRRIILTSYNPAQVDEGVLYPCHTICAQFYISNSKYLDMYCFNRSSDLGLGLPFNIASSALLLTIIASLTDLKPRYLEISIGDAHVYSNHIEQLERQIKHFPYIFPELKINKSFKTLQDVEGLSASDFEFVNYKHYPALKMEMVA
jgi:thymidylate synthase/dihydrofolate reductase